MLEIKLIGKFLSLKLKKKKLSKLYISIVYFSGKIIISFNLDFNIDLIIPSRTLMDQFFNGIERNSS